jgi:hypothetical protein
LCGFPLRGGNHLFPTHRGWNIMQCLQGPFTRCTPLVYALLPSLLLSGGDARCDDRAPDSSEGNSQLDLSTAPPELRAVLGNSAFEAVHVTGKQLELLDVFLPPLKRRKDDLQRYGHDVSVVFRLYSQRTLLKDERRLTELRVKLKPDQKKWPYTVPMAPRGPIEIPLDTFRGGVLYQIYRVYGPENGVGADGRRETLISGRWEWQVAGGAWRAAKERATPLWESAVVRPSRDSDEARLSVDARFATGKDMRLLDKLFNPTEGNPKQQPSDDDLYVVIRLHTVRSLGERTILIKATLDVFADGWPFPDVPFPAQSIQLSFIEVTDGVVYSFTRIDDLPHDWGKGGARKLLLSKEWKTQCHGIMIK